MTGGEERLGGVICENPQEVWAGVRKHCHWFLLVFCCGAGNKTRGFGLWKQREGSSVGS